MLAPSTEVNDSSFEDRLVKEGKLHPGSYSYISLFVGKNGHKSKSENNRYIRLRRDGSCHTTLEWKKILSCNSGFEGTLGMTNICFFNIK